MVYRKLITHAGKTQSVSDWARELGTTKQNVSQRLKRHKTSDALRDADGRKTVHARAFATWVKCKDGRMRTIKHAAEFYKVGRQTIERWIREKRLMTYSENQKPRAPRKCSHCGQPKCAVNRCPKLYLEDRAGRRVPFAPPTSEELRDAGILPKTRASEEPDE